MGIRFDWEIEAEQEHLRTTGEDPESIRQRRRTQMRFILFVGVVLLILAGIAGVITYRLRQVDWQVEQLLRDTVDAEVSTLRIGDRDAFLTFQRSASEEWLRRQASLFDRYQNLKLNQDANLTGRILDVAIDGTRGRVMLEEIIDGAPYARVWFYWRYEDGWRHVPPDYTFWGDPRSITHERVVVNYRSFDEPVAQAIAPQVNTWLTTACEVLICNDVPQVSIEIVPDEVLTLGWTEPDSWRLQVPSPYTRDARTDMLFDPATQLAMADVLAERLVAQTSGGMQPAPTADAAFLRQSVVSWLAQRFVGLQTDAYLIDTLAQQYGAQSVGRLVQALTPDAPISILNTVTGTTSLDQANLDWRDFLTWRLRQEQERITAGDLAGFLALYDTNDPAVAALANQRFGTMPGEQTVASVLRQSGELRTLVQVAETSETRDVLFRLVDGVWKRAS